MQPVAIIEVIMDIIHYKEPDACWKSLHAYWICPDIHLESFDKLCDGCYNHPAGKFWSIFF